MSATDVARIRRPSTPTVDVAAIHRRLRARETTGELLAEVADAAPRVCGFARGTIVTPDCGRLTALGDPQGDPAGELLRRRLLAEPAPIQRGSQEHLLLRPGASDEQAAGRPSALRAAFDLGEVAFGVIAPENDVLALILVERAGPPAREHERAALHAFSDVASVVLERVLLRARVNELTREMRYLTTSLQALGAEVLTAPLSLPSAGRHTVTFTGPFGDATSAAGGVGPDFTDRERQVMQRLVQGRSNRQIAEEFVISTETVKLHVSNLLRKLNAANRAEAVGRYLTMVG
jgi:DNA-binding CsgD family transcriptional regulator